MSENRYINLVETSLEVIRNSHVPLRSSKYSNKKYTQHQLLTLIILKEEIRMNYRDFSELLHILTPIREILRLKDIPHFTTIQKFLSRIPALTFRIILKKVIRNIHQKGEIIRITSIDSTGFTSSYASHYYSKRINKTRKSFIKASIAVDSDKLIVLGWKFSKVPVHDSQHAKSLMNQVIRITKSECFTMDKGYDSEKIHQYIREIIGAESVIPVRKWDGKIYSGKYRREMIENFNQQKYGQRNMVETVFSVIKRRYGENVRSRKYYNQLKEIKIRMVLHNMTL
ncbi:transposase IS4 family protein [Methanolacinia petrolearia DSM 11571]|uniref:Transposase IS4 family protein n=1 Tax=Methanolacinia petrolearia (strain DSM 11571 / OCM 486 / SEBR 4847) TaxID=679926 RepID=E1RFL5_METP4|nr:IS5 family transposase [Methanolacinia petrolearia]ADN37319.1 transposase IS4 family protein [Methanolacinia petrolearia DSM 11571]